MGWMLLDAAGWINSPTASAAANRPADEQTNKKKMLMIGELAEDIVYVTTSATLQLPDD